MSNPVSKKIINCKDLSAISNKLKSQNKKIVFTSGTFDLIHVGHARYITEAKKQGDILFIGVPTNKTVKRVKGRTKPIVDEESRVEMLAFLEAVDYVFLMTEAGVKRALSLLKPHYFVSIQEDWNNNIEHSSEYKTLIRHGGELIILPRQAPFLSTTAIIEKVIADKIKSAFGKYMKRELNKALKG